MPITHNGVSSEREVSHLYRVLQRILIVFPKGDCDSFREHPAIESLIYRLGGIKMRKPLRGECYCYLSNSWFEISMTAWCDDLTDEARWRAGNVFSSLEQAEQARGQLQRLLVDIQRTHPSQLFRLFTSLRISSIMKSITYGLQRSINGFVAIFI